MICGQAINSEMGELDDAEHLLAFTRCSIHTASPRAGRCDSILARSSVVGRLWPRGEAGLTLLYPLRICDVPLLWIQRRSRCERVAVLFDLSLQPADGRRRQRGEDSQQTVDREEHSALNASGCEHGRANAAES